jgi:hypothetical protein
VPRPYRYPALSEATAAAMVERRFGAYFARLSEPEEAP